MLEDAYGHFVTTRSYPTVHAINRYIEQSLCYGKAAKPAILEALAADPTCALAHAYAAAYYLAQENTIAWQRAKPHLQAANAWAMHTTERERLFIQATNAWAAGEIHQAVALHEAISDRFPRDLMAVQQGQYHYFYLGDRQGLLKIAEKVLSANTNQPYLYGMVAFGLEQCHRLQNAEQMAHRAIEINACDPWAQHAIAHVLETQQRTEAGIHWMEQFTRTWEHCNTMLYTHNYWHLALFYLAEADIQTVLDLYDTQIWGRACKASPKDQVGAIALLLRLELQGVNVGDRWVQLCPYLFARIHEHALPFQDLHYVYAVAKAGYNDRALEMLASMQAHAVTVAPQLQSTWMDLAIPAAKGLIAHAQADWFRAMKELKPVLSRLWALGGSHAQRKLFNQIYRHAEAKMALYPAFKTAS
ncbi:MAG: tetratricopeptide repeat protein [Elainellaceae cyanobacterium]